jgi:carboxyl-terminal processing protease
MPRLGHFSRKIIALACMALVLSGSAFVLDGAGSTARATAQAATGPGEFGPTERQRRVSKLVSSVIERSHYRQSPINDPVSSLVLDRYVEALDGGHSYLLASDVASFEKYRYKLDDAVLTGQIEPVFGIFNLFQQRNRERIEFAIALLDKEPDFTIEESFEFDRSKAPWAKSTAELDDIWRKRVKNDALSLIMANKSWDEVHDILVKRYERVLKRIDQVTSDDVFEIFMNSFAHVFDPHSSYFSPRNSEEYRIQMSLSYEGIGASLQLVDDYVTILNVLPGGPAAADGELNVNDRITAVAEGSDGAFTDVIGWRLDDVVQLIRGKGGTVVRLQVLPAGAAPGAAEKVVALTRNKVTLEAQASQKNVRTIHRGDRDVKIGVIDVPSFYQDFNARAAGDKDYRSTTRDVRRLIGELKKEGVEGLVMDLRGNGGGHLSEATGLAGLFIPGGPVVQLRETGGRIEVLDDPEPNIAWDGPLVVLVDRYSASASEIFAAAIQDYGRGLVIGQRTYGKGSVQNLYPLDRYALGPDPSFGQLTVTIGKYYRVTGESTQHRGVQPDITLPSAIDPDEVGESNRESALPWDRIRSVDFGHDATLRAASEHLEQLHEVRIAHDPDYQALLGEIHSYEELRSRKTVSLNLKARLAERDALDTARLARENARRAAHGDAPVPSLDQLDQSVAPDAVLAEATEIVGDLRTVDNNYLTRIKEANLKLDKQGVIN